MKKLAFLFLLLFQLTPAFAAMRVVEPLSEAPKINITAKLVGVHMIFQSEITATSCTRNAVQAAMTAAVMVGVIVNIPSCPAGVVWTDSVDWLAPANAILRGAGTNAVGGGDQTVIIDSFQNVNPLITITTNASGTFRMTGFTVQGGNSGGNVKFQGIIAIGGQSKLFRMDHIHINSHTYSPLVQNASVRFTNYVTGVVDHLVLDSHSVGNGIQVHYERYNGVSSDTGHAAWAAPTGFGTSDFIFVEDNIFNTNSRFGAVDDCDIGGKVVVRHNTIYKQMALTHPTNDGSGRGCVAMEIYQNTYLYPGFNPSIDAPVVNAIWHSSGAELVWGNSATQGYAYFYSMVNQRRTGSQQHRSNGTYDESRNTDGIGYCGPPPQSGTVNTNGNAVTWVSGQKFNPAWLAGTMIYIAADGGGYRIGSVQDDQHLTLAPIGADTSTPGVQTGAAYTMGSNIDGNTDPINGYPCVDQATRGQSDLLGGTWPSGLTNITAGCTLSSACWPHQKLMPTYLWSNDWNPVPFTSSLYVNAGGPGDIHQEDRDWFVQKNGFTGATGMGVGLLAARPACSPSTCLVNVGYWATDQGNWNQSGTGGQGKLYAWNGTTWVDYYTPYTYPHPLVSNAASIISVTPSTGVQGASGLSLSVVGSNTAWSNGVTVASFSGTGITVNSTTCSSATTCTVSVSISSMATASARNLVMTTSMAVETLVNGFTVTETTPTKLTFLTQPASSIMSGASFGVSGAVQFSNSTTDTSSTASVTIALCNGSPSGGTLGGVLTTNAVAGVATFSGLSITTNVTAPAYSLCLTSSGLTSATSNSFTVTVESNDVCTTKPLTIDGMKWPTAPTGSRSLSWNSHGFNITNVSFTYPGTAIFTDTRGCTKTMLK